MGESRKGGCGSEVTVAMIGCTGSIIAAVIGGIFTLISVWGGPTISNTTAPLVPGTSNTTTVDIPTPETFVQEQPEVVQPTTSCPQAAGGFWLQFPDTWYGPYGNGDALAFHSAGGFSVWDVDWVNLDGTVGVVIPYPDPALQFPRNQWVPLQQSIFTVCIDGAGNVFGWAG